MFPGDSGKLLLGILIGLALIQGPVVAGMPAPLPTNWTKDSTPSWARSSETAADNGSGNARLQAISFFVACLLLSAWGDRCLCRDLRKEVTWLPELT